MKPIKLNAMLYEYIVDFCGTDSITEIEIVSEITGISIEELRTLDGYICFDCPIEELPIW
jgi:hypothetical protein